MSYSTPCFLITLLSIIFIWLEHKFNHWKRKNVPTPTLKLFLELFKMGILQENSFADRDFILYNYFKSQHAIHGGTYFYHLPVYIPMDLKLIKHILQVDYQHFTDRGLYVNEKGDPLSAHLFSLGGEKWKTLRKKLTPTFTSGKMKMMFQTIQDCTYDLRKVFELNFCSEVDVKDIMGRFTMDVIANVAFGIKCKSLDNPNCEFRQKAQTVFRTDFLAALKHGILYAFPELMQSFNIKILNQEASSFFMNVIRNTVDYRQKNDINRKDFLHLLIQLQNKEDRLVKEDQIDRDSLTIEEVAAQAFIFFEAGYESSSNTMSFCLYELSLNAMVQARVRDEISEVLDRYDGILTYEAVEEMKYLEQTICETLRKYPPLSSLFRICTEEYKLPDTDIVLEKGTRVLIPTYGIHHDPEYYPNPEKFDPERFSTENRGRRLDCTFLPFGIGPRVCIAQRFGKLQVKIGLISLLRNFEFNPCQKTQIPLVIDPESFTVAPKSSLLLQYKRIAR